MFGSIASFIAELLLRGLADPEMVAEALPQHAEILDAIVVRDGEAAHRLEVEHLTLAGHHYGPDLDLPLRAGRPWPPAVRGRPADGA